MSNSLEVGPQQMTMSLQAGPQGGESVPIIPGEEWRAVEHKSGRKSKRRDN